MISAWKVATKIFHNRSAILIILQITSTGAMLCVEILMAGCLPLSHAHIRSCTHTHNTESTGTPQRDFCTVNVWLCLCVRSIWQRNIFKHVGMSASCTYIAHMYACRLASALSYYIYRFSSTTCRWFAIYYGYVHSSAMQCTCACEAEVDVTRSLENVQTIQD